LTNERTSLALFIAGANPRNSNRGSLGTRFDSQSFARSNARGDIGALRYAAGTNATAFWYA